MPPAGPERGQRLGRGKGEILVCTRCPLAWNIQAGVFFLHLGTSQPGRKKLVVLRVIKNPRRKQVKQVCGDFADGEADARCHRVQP